MAPGTNLDSILKSRNITLSTKVRIVKAMDFLVVMYGCDKKMGKKWKPSQILFSWAPKSLWVVTAAMKLKDACCLEEQL